MNEQASMADREPGSAGVQVPSAAPRLLVTPDLHEPQLSVVHAFPRSPAVLCEAIPAPAYMAEDHIQPV